MKHRYLTQAIFTFNIVLLIAFGSYLLATAPSEPWEGFIDAVAWLLIVAFVGLLTGGITLFVWDLIGEVMDWLEDYRERIQ